MAVKRRGRADESRRRDARLAVRRRKYCPPTAQFAYRQGICLGKNLADILKGASNPPRTFTFTGLGELASIGHQSAVADIMGHRFSGLIAWFMWRTIYLMKLPGLDRKVRVVIDWTLDLFFPRDITLLRSRPTEVLQEVPPRERRHRIPRRRARALLLRRKSGPHRALNDSDGPVMSIGPGEHFGERALLHDRKWRFTAVAAEPTTLVALEAKVFQAISSASASIHEFFEHSSSNTSPAASRVDQKDRPRSGPEAEGQRSHEPKHPSAFRTTGTIAEALAIMVKHPFNSFPVLDEKETLLGIITQSQVYDALKEGAITRESTMENYRPAPSLPSMPTCSLTTPSKP